MIYKLLPLLIGFCIDLLMGDPHSIPHPVIWIGKLITLLERGLRAALPKNKTGEILAGGILWLIVTTVSSGVPVLILYFAGRIHPWLAAALESVMCWQILAVRSLRVETMKVYYALRQNDISKARYAVSMVVGRDTEKLDGPAVTRAAVETIAENTADGIIAPLFFMALGGAPAGFFYKAVNTMDSMLGYIEPPYKNIGLIPAKMDDIANFIPARAAAILMLIVGKFQKLNVKNGWNIFVRDRYKHASPNSAQTEAVCAGLLGVRLAGDAWYHGMLHKKEFIGDPLREIETEDIPRMCRLSYGTSFLMLVISCLIRYIRLS